MSAEARYIQLGKPSWAPPGELFAPVWTVLYFLIAISYGYLLYLGSLGVVGWNILVPLVLNLIFNLLYYPLQFWFKSNLLATIDILLVLITLIWLLVAIWTDAPQYSWTAYVNIPYLAWVIFATFLQLYISYQLYFRKNS